MDVDDSVPDDWWVEDWAPATRDVCSTVRYVAIAKVGISTCFMGSAILLKLAITDDEHDLLIPILRCVTIGLNLILGLVGIIAVVKSKQQPVPQGTCRRLRCYGCVNVLPWSMAFLDAWFLLGSFVALGKGASYPAREQPSMGVLAMTCAASMASALVTVAFAGLWMRRLQAQCSEDHEQAKDLPPRQQCKDRSHTHSANVNDFRASLARDAQKFEAAYCIAEFIFILAYVIYMQMWSAGHGRFYVKARRFYRAHLLFAPLCLLVRVYRCIKIKPSWGMDMLNTLLDAAFFTWCAILAGSIGQEGSITLVFNIMLSYMLIFVFPFRRALTVVPLCYLTYCTCSALMFVSERKTPGLRSSIPSMIAELGALGIGLVLSVSAKRIIELSKWEAFMMFRKKAAEAIHEKVLRVEAEFAHEAAVTKSNSDHCKEASGSSTCENMLPSLMSAPAILQTASADDASSACSQQNSSSGDCLPPDAKVWVEGYAYPRLLCELKVGERILCYDRLSGNLKHSEISTLELKEGNTNWSLVCLADGTTLKMTSDHPVQLNMASSHNAVVGQPAPVRAGDLQPKRDSLAVLKLASVPVDAVRQVEEVGQRISLSVKQPLRHSIFVAGQGDTVGGGGGFLQAMCVESADVPSQSQMKLGESRTFVHLTDELSDTCQLRRTLSEPSGFPQCLLGQDVNHDALPAATPIADAPPSQTCSYASSSISGCQSADVLIASALTLAPACQETDNGTLVVVPAGANPSARLSDLLRVQASGFCSLGSIAHNGGNCQPCAFQNRYRQNGIVLSCRKGLLCERCHQNHEGSIRQHKRRMSQHSKRKPAGINPDMLADSQTAEPATTAAAAAAAEAAAASAASTVSL